MTTTDKLKEELIRLLVRATEDQTVAWEVTADETTFRLTSSLGNIRISKSDKFDPDMMDSYTDRSLCILNDRGRVIEEFSPDTSSEEIEFDKLYTFARRSACNTNSILKEMINELKMKVPE